MSGKEKAVDQQSAVREIQYPGGKQQIACEFHFIFVVKAVGFFRIVQLLLFHAK